MDITQTHKPKRFHQIHHLRKCFFVLLQTNTIQKLHIISRQHFSFSVAKKKVTTHNLEKYAYRGQEKGPI